MPETFKIFAAGSLLLLSAATQPSGNGPEIRTSDVDRFYRLYDSAGGKPNAQQLQAYIDGGTEGFLAFAKMRKTNGERIAQSIEKQPQIYSEARKCAAALPSVRMRLSRSLDRLKQLYPEAILPPITLAVGRGKPVGTADQNGVMIGLEALCAADLMNPDVEDRFVHVIAHEYVQVQQSRFYTEDPKETVLRAALTEGAAEFVGELTSGSVSYGHLPALVQGREVSFEAAFLAEIDKTAIGSAWLYNHPGTAEQPADLGYWIGYRITKSYYRQAKDQRAALRDIIEMRDPKAFLAESGWQPGIKLN